MATHPSVLAWRIPGMAEPGGLPSMGSHRVRHDWSDLAAAANLLFSSTYFRVLQLNYTWTVYHPLNSLGKNTEVGSLSLLQGIFPTQGSNPGLLHCRQILYQLSHQGSPRILGWVAYPFSSRFPDPGIKLGSSALQVDSLPSWLPGKPKKPSNVTIISNLIVVTLWSM